MRSALWVLVAACGGTGPDSGSRAPVDVRAPGERAPLTAPCDDQDESRCILPFPSNRFTRLDDDSLETGLRVALDPSGLPAPDDDPAFVNTHDGFSRISPMMTAWPLELDTGWLAPVGQPVAADAPIRVYNAQPDHPDYGAQVEIWAEVVTDGTGTSMVLAHPLYPLAEAADHVVVVTSDLVDATGAPVPRSRHSAVALGLEPAAGPEEVELAWYHGPTRALLEEVGLSPSEVVRAWDFTTRSQHDVSRRMLHMLDGVAAARASFGVEIDRVEGSDNPDVAVIVEGRVTGVPHYLSEDDRFVFDAAGLPEATGSHDALFRILMPSRGYDGTEGGPVRVGLYGHGTGGDIHDSTLDETFAANGVAKVGIQFGAWNGIELFDTFARVLSMNRGVEQSTGQLIQSLADGYAVYLALSGPLGEALQADEIGGQANPAAGRALLVERPLWAAGSLGGTMGAIIGSTWPEVEFAALNVPGGAWTHFIPHSYLYSWVMKDIMESNYGGAVNARLAIGASQAGWDDVDGATWADVAREEGVVFLLQESVEDSVMPNVGTELLARALEADHVGVPITSLPGIDAVDELRSAPGLTQFRVPATGEYDVHGFAGRDTPAGEAAMDQIFGFARACWEGEPRIEVPDGCWAVSADGACDFSTAW